MIRDQLKFVEAMDLKVHDRPTIDKKILEVCFKLIKEEYQELSFELAQALSMDTYDEKLLMANITAEAVDLVYVIFQLINQLGLPFEEMFEIIHEANMRKVGSDGKVTKNSAGKVVKPKGWKGPDIQYIINRYIKD